MTVTKPPRNIGTSAIAAMSAARYSGTSSVRHDAPGPGAERAWKTPGSRRQATTPSAMFATSMIASAASKGTNA